jgi:hypothetical protein
VTILVTYDSLYFSFDSKYNKITQAIIVTNVPFNQIIEVRLTDSSDISATYQMVVEFVCTPLNISGYPDADHFFKMPQASNKSNGMPFNPYIKPVWIAAISRTGLVKIMFYQALFVPNFTITTSN